MSKFSLNDVISWGETSEPILFNGPWTACLRHVQTQGLAPDGEPSRAEGITVWEARWHGRRVGLAWRWLRRGHRVVALADPMQIAANVPLAWADGLVLPAERAIVELNNIVHGLAWQAQVCHELDGGAQPRRARVALRPGEHRRPEVVASSADLLSPA
jgi:hypothetical protein